MRGYLPLIGFDLTKKPAPIVIAQDAAGGGAGDSGTRHGAFCLAVAAPPRDEILQVINATTLQGKARALPSLLLGARSALAVTPHDMPLTLRSQVRRHWCEGGVQWHAVLARKWKTHMDIAEGESRAVGVWGRDLLRYPGSRGQEVFDISDNFSVVAVFSRGRTQPLH